MEVSKLVPSFSIDHLILEEGLYLREVKRVGLFSKLHIWDLRFHAPSKKTYMTQKVMHTIEHIFAVKLRILLGTKDYVSFSPMGCTTGFTLITTSKVSYSQLRLVLMQICKDSMHLCSKQEIPCLTDKECGRPSLYALEDTNYELYCYHNVLSALSEK